MRTCTKCSVSKPRDAFNKARGYADGHQRQCKECMKVARKAWRKRGGLKKEASTPAYKARQNRYRRNIQSEAPSRLATRKRAQQWRLEQMTKDPVKAKAKASEWSRGYRKRKAAAGPEPSEAAKARLVAEYSGCCAYCRDGKAECLDHVVPLTMGGLNEIENRVPSCLSCNGIKKDRPLLVFLSSKAKRKSGPARAAWATAVRRGQASGISLGS
jgi:hypothetical protein